MRINSLVLATLIALLALTAPAFAARTSLDITVPSTARTNVEPRVDADEPYWQVEIAWETSSADAVVVWWDEDGRGDDERLGPFPVDSYGKGSVTLTFRTPVGAAYSDRQVVIQPTTKDGTPLDEDGEETTTDPVQETVTFRLLPYQDSVPIHRLIPIDWWPVIWLVLGLVLLLLRPRNLRLKDKGTVIDVTVGVPVTHPIVGDGLVGSVSTGFFGGDAVGNGLRLHDRQLIGTPAAACELSVPIWGRLLGIIPLGRSQLLIRTHPARATYPEIKGTVGTPLSPVAPTCPFPIRVARFGGFAAGTHANPRTGEVMGTPTAHGQVVGQVELGDGHGHWTELVSVVFTIAEKPKPVMTVEWSSSTITGKAGTHQSVNLVVKHPPSGATVTVTGVTKAAANGLDLSWDPTTNTGSLSGTLGKPGTYPVTATAVAGSESASAVLTIETTK